MTRRWHDRLYQTENRHLVPSRGRRKLVLTWMDKGYIVAEVGKSDADMGGYGRALLRNQANLDAPILSHSHTDLPER